MSFRKRNEPLAGGPPGLSRASGIATSRPISRVPIAIERPGRISGNDTTTEKLPVHLSNPAVRPSPVTSQPTISTGTPDLDKILTHLGLPLGTVLVVEESGTTDFSSVLLRGFAAQGVVHNRSVKNSHVIVVGVNSAWANTLPGEYKGSSKEQKKSRIAEDSARVSVANMAEKDLKIAWRYGSNAGRPEPESESAVSSTHYVSQFDITTRLVPGPAASEMTFVPLKGTYLSILSAIASVLASQALRNVVRIVFPGFLNPSVYAPAWSTLSQIVPFFHGLRALLSKHPAVAMVSLPLDLYPRDSLVTHMIETLAEGVVHLEPFHPDVAALVERAHKSDPAKVQHGLVHVEKVPVVSERGMMAVQRGEYAFRNGRRKFEIEPWGIPVEEEEPTEGKPVDF